MSVTTIIRQQAGLPAHTITRVESGGTTTTTTGSGDEAIVRTVVKSMLGNSQQEEVETLRRAGDATPARCTRTLKQRTSGGWLTLQTTEAYGTPLARTTYHAYNDQYQLSRVIRPDGGYTEYEYDAEGRVSTEISPWGSGGRQRTRYVYAAHSARFYDNRPIKVYTDYQEANSGSWLNLTVVDYTYSPYGEVSASGDVIQPIQWSSEAWDEELGLIYYNWRYYQAFLGKWTTRDPFHEMYDINLYSFIRNNNDNIDSLGTKTVKGTLPLWKGKGTVEYSFDVSFRRKRIEVTLVLDLAGRDSFIENKFEREIMSKWSNTHGITCGNADVVYPIVFKIKWMRWWRFFTTADQKITAGEPKKRKGTSKNRK